MVKECRIDTGPCKKALSKKDPPKTLGTRMSCKTLCDVLYVSYMYIRMYILNMPEIISWENTAITQLLTRMSLSVPQFSQYSLVCICNYHLYNKLHFYNIMSKNTLHNGGHIK